MVSSSLPEMREHLQKAVDYSPVHDLEFRPMFGGIMAYIGGRPFASLSHVGLALKLPPDAQEELLQAPLARRLQYSPTDPVSKQYIVLPDDYLGNDDKLRYWVLRSMDFALTLPLPRRRGRSSKALR